MTLTELTEVLPGVQIIGSSAIMHGKYVGHSDLDTVALTEYGRELLNGPSEVVVDELPVMEVPSTGKGKGGKGGKSKAPEKADDPLELDIE